MVAGTRSADKAGPHRAAPAEARTEPEAPPPELGGMEWASGAVEAVWEALPAAAESNLAVLTGTTNHDLGTVQVGATSAPFFWTLTNAAGAQTTGGLNLSNDDPAETVVTANGCTAPLAGGGSCTVTITFTASAPGPRIANLMMTTSPGGGAIMTITAVGQATLTVTTTGTGSVTSVPAGISCPGTCSAAFSMGSVTLQAHTTNGSNSFFTGWSDPACAGPNRDCATTLTHATNSVTATFQLMDANLIFLTSATFPTNLGSAAAYDNVCNTAASAAGINVTAGNGYVAVTSDATSNAITRLGAGRGWVRMDGKPFADTATTLFKNNQVFYPLTFDELGRPHGYGPIATGTSSVGTYSGMACSNWTDGGGPSQVSIGNPIGGPLDWIDWNQEGCTPWPFICMGITKNSAVGIGTVQGRRIWVSPTAYTPNATTTPDSVCQGNRPAGVTTAMAFISTTKRAAAALLDPTISYYRPDNAFVGTGAAILTNSSATAASQLISGIWQSGDGTYDTIGARGVWVGSPTPNDIGTTASTCADWTDPNQTGGMVGTFTLSTSYWWNVFGANLRCTYAESIYCVQTAP